MWFFFFFQAEDGIRDDLVTGVQTCALPICRTAGLPIARVRGPADGDVTAFVVFVRAPAAAGALDVVLGSVQGRGLPTERGELARAGDGDRAGWLAALRAQVRPAGVQTTLRAPGDLDDAGILAGVAGGELVADARPATIVVSGLDQQPPRVRRPGLGDRPLDALLARGVFARDDPEKPRQQSRLGEPLKAPDLGAQPGRGQRVDPAEAAQPGDRRGVAARRDGVLEYRDQRPPPLNERVDRAHIVDEHRLRERVVEAQPAKPAPVRLRPRPAGEAQPAAQQELRQAMTRTHQVFARVIDAADQVTEALVWLARHEREAQLAGGEQPDQPLGVTPIGLYPIARRPGNRSRRDHAHVQSALGRRSREPEPRRPGLIDRAHRRPSASNSPGTTTAGSP